MKEIRQNVVLKLKFLDELNGILSEENMEKTKKDSRYSSTTFNVYLNDLSDEELNKFLEWLKAKSARQAALKVKSFIDVKENPGEANIKGLKNFQIAFTEEMKNIEHKWIFININGEFLPYLVSEIGYKESIGRGESYTEPYVYARLKYNGIGGFSEKSISFTNGDCNNLKLAEILANNDVYIENEDLISDFTINENKYLNEKRNFNKQYKGTGILKINKGYYGGDIQIVGANLINDEEVNSNSVHRRVSTAFWNDENEPETFFAPCHPYLYVYSLSTYENGFVHVSQIKDYVYDDSLRDKLVLPPTHRDLIDILSDDLSILSGDIIEGKSTGTTILCKGLPGTGKTLTAEVYSEITHRPLYKINAGVLGLHYDDIEKNLETILKRAERWGAVLLIDEADTYIRKRGNDNGQNAVVAAFLRTLEYFNGLLFLTTNRIDDIDDAIESRCIARILYELPTEESAKRIWHVLSKEFELNISDELIDDLVKTFPNISGRDIKELLRLTGRFCNGKGYDLSLEHFVSCAQFRGLHIEEMK